MGSKELEIASEQQYGQVQRQMSKMVELMQKGYYSFRPGESWAPSVNLYETDGEYLVCVDLGGVEKEKIDIEVLDQRLSIKGNRAVPTFPGEIVEGDGKKYRVHLMEIDYGLFSREIELPVNVKKDQIQATHRNGMLWIELPKEG